VFLFVTRRNFTAMSIDLGATHADADHEIDVIVSEIVLRYQGEKVQSFSPSEPS